MMRGMPLASALATSCAIGAVRTYQWTVRPIIGPNCRFWPSCSDYAIEAFRQHGTLRGSALTARRILRCNPWHEGGVDMVPKRDGASPGSINDVNPHALRRDGSAARQQPDDQGTVSDQVTDHRPPSLDGDNFVTGYREQARGPIGPTPTRDQRARVSQMGH